MFEEAIRERVALLFGEGDGDSVYRCPGDSCDIWAATGGEYEERKMVCLDCQRCKGKPPLLNQSSSPEAVKQRIIGRIESLVCQENAGHLDKEYLDYFEWKLIEVWRDAELRHDRLFKIHTKLIFEALTRQS